MVCFDHHCLSVEGISHGYPIPQSKSFYNLLSMPTFIHNMHKMKGKKDSWISLFTFDPRPALLSSGNKAVAYFAARDLAGSTTDNIESIWDLPEAQKIVRKQQEDGSWKYPGGNQDIRSSENYDQIETYRNLGYLVECYGFDKTNPVIPKAADFLFRFQTKAGDIRGILGNQYAPYYTAAMIELLIKAGYSNDKRVEKAFKWLEAIRQNDGGWAIPLRTRNKKPDVIAMESATIEPDRSKPFSHLATGVVLRAYAAHEHYRTTPEAQAAGKLLLNNLFKKDNYTDRGTMEYWLRFTYPFWFTDLISAMDSLSLLGFKKDEPQIEKAVEWFLTQQQDNGLWKLKTLKNKSLFQTELWLSLAICRIVKRLYA